MLIRIKENAKKKTFGLCIPQWITVTTPGMLAVNLMICRNIFAPKGLTQHIPVQVMLWSIRWFPNKHDFIFKKNTIESLN